MNPISLFFCFIPLIPAWDWPWTSNNQRFVNHVHKWQYSKGYLECETHEIETDDGYLLTAFRLTPQEGAHSTPIVLQHGFLDSAFGFVLGDNSIAQFLWENGYDVWLPNNRGNMYSMKHVKYSTSENRFWKFSVTEFALYDFPAALAYISHATGFEKFPVVGHSQGATQIIIAASDENHDAHKQSLKAKELAVNHIETFIALSPVIFIENTNCGPCRQIAQSNFIPIYASVNQKNLLPSAWALRLFLRLACAIPGLRNVCGATAGEVVGKSRFDEPKTLDQWFQAFPAGTSVKACERWDEWLNAREEQSLPVGSPVSVTQLETLSVPSHFFYGLYDDIISTKDRRKSSKILERNKNVKSFRYFEDFSHITWQIGDSGSQNKIQGAICTVIGCSFNGSKAGVSMQDEASTELESVQPSMEEGVPPITVDFIPHIKRFADLQNAHHVHI